MIEDVDSREADFLRDKNLKIWNEGINIKRIEIIKKNELKWIKITKTKRETEKTGYKKGRQKSNSSKEKKWKKKQNPRR